ncbi:hypothetical protein PSEUBRA_001389 [Kalmanozyma brasiliensis GHG001]|uniref:uncharacterized protein n=1 Tax=Kalmanozyma brasiliensis (strain GHG001) TaxID=1365824 RepID=UPI0028682574|nr:uncharacterized protein PSEUBRA_001389 [Kalmanozyma brasiliensis GHG001]KAF6766929.1 hypothetical protein PSEUBRA_001389 [Kalmanozyma brasiliensis GHG001]
MSEFTYVAGNCLVPLSGGKINLTVRHIRNLPHYHAMQPLSAADERTHTAADRDHMWISAVYKVPTKKVPAMMHRIRGLPYFKTQTYPGNDEAEDKSHVDAKHELNEDGSEDGDSPGVAAQSSAQDDEDSDNENDASSVRPVVKNGSENDNEGSKREEEESEVDEEETSYDHGNADGGDDVDDATTPQDKQQKAEADRNDEIILAETQSMAETVGELQQLLAAPPEAGSTDGSPRSEKRPRISQDAERMTMVAHAAPPQTGVPATMHKIIGPWRMFKGRGDSSNPVLQAPSQAALCPLPFITAQRDRTTRRLFINIYGMVDWVGDLTVSRQRPRSKERYWRVRIVDPRGSDKAFSVFVFPAADTYLEIGTPLPGLKAGDLLLVLDAYVPNNCKFASAKEVSAIFVAEDAAEATVQPVD